MIVWSLFIISHMGLFVYTQKGSIISMVDLPTTEIIEPSLLLLFDGCAYRLMSSSGRAMVSFPLRSTTRTDGG